jgi:hypothetical protein
LAIKAAPKKKVVAKKAPAKAPAKKAAPKKAPAKAPAKAAAAKPAKKKGSVAKGDKLYCDACGIVVTVDEPCGCAVMDIVCCGKAMKPKKAKAKAKK